MACGATRCGPKSWHGSAGSWSPAAQPADEASPAQREEEPEEPLDLELLRLEAEQVTPRKCRGCGGKMVETYQTPRPTVAQLMRMPPSMEMPVESGPVQLYLPLSAFL